MSEQQLFQRHIVKGRELRREEEDGQEFKTVNVLKSDTSM